MKRAMRRSRSDSTGRDEMPLGLQQGGASSTNKGSMYDQQGYVIEPEFRPLPPSGYSLLPPSTNQSAPSHSTSATPHFPFPHMPFWTAAPMPFSPQLYPQNVLPPGAKEALLHPKAPPNPPVVARKKTVGARRTAKGRKSKVPGRARGANGAFARSSESPGTAAPTPPRETYSGGEESSSWSSSSPLSPSSESEELFDSSANALMSRIAELQQQLLSSQYESNVLRQQLVASQVELSQLKDLGLVQTTMRTYAAASNNNGPSSVVQPKAPLAYQKDYNSGQLLHQFLAAQQHDQELHQQQQQHQHHHQQQQQLQQQSHGHARPVLQQPLGTGYGAGFGGPRDEAFRISLDLKQLKARLKPTGINHEEDSSSV